MSRYGKMKSFFLIIASLMIGNVAAFTPIASLPNIPKAARFPSSSTRTSTELGMKCRSSIGAMKRRSKTCQVIRRRGRIYLIDKKNPRNKVRQGGAKMKKRKKK